MKKDKQKYTPRAARNRGKTTRSRNSRALVRRERSRENSRSSPSPTQDRNEGQARTKNGGSNADDQGRSKGRMERGGGRGGTLKSGPAIKRANYPPSHKCTPSNIFFLRSLREHSKRTRALAYASCISRRRWAHIMPRKSPRMHIIYGSGSCIESSWVVRVEGNAPARQRERQRGEGGRGETNKAKGAPRRRIYSAKFTAKTYLPRASPEGRSWSSTRAHSRLSLLPLRIFGK